VILLGHKFIQSESLYHVTSIDAIVNTPPSCTLFLNFKEENLDIISHAQNNNVTFALKVANITEVIYASSLGAKYIVVEKALAKTAQDIAENYLFDAKILVEIQKDEEIEGMALLNIDGVIYPQAIIH
jgi:hypothetical protein